MSRISNKKSGVQQISIDSGDESRRIDNFLMSRFKGLPRTRIYQMLRRGEVRVNKGRKKPGYRLQVGDVLRIPPVSVAEQASPGTPPAYLVDRLRDAVIFENEELLAINKPAGIVVHSGSGRSFGVIEILRYLRPMDEELQLVHRIDQATSGCLLLSKTSQGLRSLHAAMKSGALEKKYIALLAGKLDSNSVKVDLALRKNNLNSGERVVRPDADGKNAETIFTLRQSFTDTSLVDVNIITGRTHQIRVHAQAIGHPVLGDDKYGDKLLNREMKKAGLGRLFLHAFELHLPEYRGKWLNIQAPLSRELAEFLKTHV